MDVNQKIREQPEEVLRLIRWWLTRDPAIKRRCMFAGGVSDVAQETYLSLLRYPPRSDKKTFTLSTVTCKQASWTLHRMLERPRLPIEDSPDVPDCEDDSEVDLFRRLHRRELQDRVKSLLQTMQYRWMRIIEMRYGLGDGHCYTLAQTARVFRVTRERIRQIEGDARDKLRFRCAAIKRFSGLQSEGCSDPRFCRWLP